MKLISNLLESDEARARVKDAGITQAASFLIEVEMDPKELELLNKNKRIWLGQTEGGVFALVPDQPTLIPRFLGSRDGEDEEWKPTNAT